MPATAATKSRKWCFTMFWNGEEPGASYFDDWEVEYIYVGKELCPETKRDHYQGYVRFPNPRALGGVRKLFTHTVKLPSGRDGYPGHWEACKGSEADNVKYCSKDGVLVVEAGDSEKTANDVKQQGKRSDIIAVRQLIQAGARMHEIVSTVNSYQAIKVAETMLKFLEPGRDWVPEVYWIYGPTGTGKSKFAFGSCADPWISGKDGKWFEGYDAHEDVIFDDFRQDFCAFHILLRLLDRYPYRVEIKGASRQFLARRIFITSCHPPDKVYPLSGEDLGQLGRRISQIIYMPNLGEAYSRPGSGIGLEPSDCFVIPERGPEQKVWGNTTGPEVPDDVGPEAPALARTQTGFTQVPEHKCSVAHGADVVCDDCEPEDESSGNANGCKFEHSADEFCTYCMDPDEAEVLGELLGEMDLDGSYGDEIDG
ncbi:replication-associated protein [Torentivirus aristcris]|uniref:ATP-dependent helicase Rep n=1 Tax=Crucivirus-295 TaxID=2761264 RepID=A0A7G5M393_9VIRU|nr:replication-associated protein [Crucivirus-295]